MTDYNHVPTPPIATETETANAGGCARYQVRETTMRGEGPRMRSLYGTFRCSGDASRLR